MARDGGNPLPNDKPGNSKLKVSIITPDSDTEREKIQETPDYIRRISRRTQIAPIELFSERCQDVIKNQWGLAAAIRDQEPSPMEQHSDNVLEFHDGWLSVNAGGINRSIVCDGINFLSDKLYVGGDTISTDVRIGDGDGLALYQSARIGDFSYKFPKLAAGDYLIDLHLAEFVVTDGPPGMRVFDVFIQEEKVVSEIDIYAQVGSNQPLILSDLKSSVAAEEGLTIRFQGLVGKPIVCGISIRPDPSAGEQFRKLAAEDIRLLSTKERGTANMLDLESKNDKCSNCWTLKQEYEVLFKEKMEVKSLLEDVRRENELKSRECNEAWASLQELQMELMRKSMHVGSLAFAVEGQVKEKSRWFLSLEDLSEKFRLLKLEHAKLSEEAVECRRNLAEMSHMTASIQSIVDRHVDLEREYRHLQFKFNEEAKEKKDLYNKLIELKGNIRVYCRCRPLNSEEIAEGATMAIDFESVKDGELTVKSSHGSFKKVFKFDNIFSPEEDQETVFEKTSPLAISVLDGYNVCIFAYGQTGTGKTFTMEGTEEARGVNYRTLEELFRVINERQGLIQYEISVSVLEVYNEQIHDLLLSEPQPGVATKRLEVRQVAEGLHHVPGLVEASVSNMNEVWEVLQVGSKARSIGATNANEHSSRSHCITCVMVRGENLMNGECTRSKLWLIDLAGSERVAKTDVMGERLKEAQCINRSLSALGDVISALANKSPHIPFRNSKLTHLLQDSLGGDSKTLMFVQISPNENDVGETLCSLNFASRVRGIELGPAKKQVDATEVIRYKQMVEKAKQDIRNKDYQIRKMEDTLHSQELKYKAKDMIIRNLQDKVKELESQLLIERKIARKHIDSKIVENQLQREQSNTSMYTPLCGPLLEKNHYPAVEQLSTLKELGHARRPLIENNNSKLVFLPQPDNSIHKHFPIPKDKENKPELPEEAFFRKDSRDALSSLARQIPTTPIARHNSLIPPSRKASRVSLCPAHQVPFVPSSRRNSLIPPLPAERAGEAGTPLPALTNTTINLSPSVPSAFPNNISNKRDGDCEAKTNTSELRSSKKFSSILRRSLQKKVIIRSPLSHNRGKRTLVGMENVRASIGKGGRLGRRVMVREGTKAIDRGIRLQDKERGWHNGTSTRNVL